MIAAVREVWAIFLDVVRPPRCPVCRERVRPKHWRDHAMWTLECDASRGKR